MMDKKAGNVLHSRKSFTAAGAGPNIDGPAKRPIIMSFRAKREIYKEWRSEDRRFLPAVEMTDSLGTTSNEVDFFLCGSGMLPRRYRGWKPLPQGRNFITE